jgi:hypothetical protein
LRSLFVRAGQLLEIKAGREPSADVAWDQALEASNNVLTGGALLRNDANKPSTEARAEN